MEIGLVKWFNEEKGFGVIIKPNKEEYFLHINSFSCKPEKLLKGTPIVFSPKTDKSKNRKTAVNSRLIGLIQDWKLIMHHLGQQKTIGIEVNITKLRSNGTEYKTKTIRLYNLIWQSLKYYFNNIKTEEISDIIIDYFNNDLDPERFISYYELIEDSIPKLLSTDIVINIQNKVFSHFRANLNEDILFLIWKQKKINLISNSEKDDYELPEKIFKAHIFEIDKTELNRIKKFSFGVEFCSFYIEKKFTNLNNLTSLEIKELYSYIEFELQEKQDGRKKQLDLFYTKKIETELMLRAHQLGIIKNNDDFKNYEHLITLIPYQVTNGDRKKIKENIHQIISEKCSDEYQVELWIKGIRKDTSFEFIYSYFFDKNTIEENRIIILTKLKPEESFVLLKSYSEEFSFEKAFELLGESLKKLNSFSYLITLKLNLYDRVFWENKKGNKLIELYIDYVDKQTSDQQKFQLFIKGYVKSVSQNIILQNIHILKNEDYKNLFEKISKDKDFIKDILTERIILDNINSLSWAYDLAELFLDNENFSCFDSQVFKTTEHLTYFNLWEIGKARIFPKNHINEILQDKFDNYAQIDKWIKTKRVTPEKISSYLLEFLNKQIPSTDRIIFYKQLNHIKYLIKLNEVYIHQIKLIQNDSYNIFLWVLDHESTFNFELLKRKFIYFSPNKQVRIIRKLFYLKASGQFDLSIEKLEEITRFDLDLYKTNLLFNKDVPIDISTDVVIKTLISFQRTNRFLVESELLTLILNDLKYNKKRRFKLSTFFENCLGRQVPKYDWHTKGSISKIKYGNNQFYFAINFPLKELKQTKTSWGYIENYVFSTNFTNLKEAVKNIPGAKWNPNTLHWGVPSKYEAEVLTFAKENRFFLDFEGSKYANNIHLTNFEREDLPNDIYFCDGRLANKHHKIYKKEFWWCAGQACFSKCETIHQTNEWEKYTLLDFCEILNLNTDETNRMGDYIPKGHYYQFISLINRFNRLLEKLYCIGCNHILFPVDTSHFAAYTVVRFHCVNQECSHNDEVYLNHCLNGQCNNIIDSRVAKRCPNGLIICNKCGSCCSHSMFQRRLDNLKLTGGSIHPKLVECVNKKLGHLERAEYYCYKCSSVTPEISPDIFQCTACDVIYDTKKFRIKRPHIHLKEVKVIIRSNGNGTNNIGF